jgi:hypothetical protein
MYMDNFIASIPEPKAPKFWLIPIQERANNYVAKKYLFFCSKKGSDLKKLVVCKTGLKRVNLI